MYPTYVAIDGDVYDTSSSPTYSPGGSYSFFAGKDAARAFGTGCFRAEMGHLNSDLRGLSEQEMQVRTFLFFWGKQHADGGFDSATGSSTLERVLFGPQEVQEGCDSQESSYRSQQSYSPTLQIRGYGPG